MSIRKTDGHKQNYTYTYLFTIPVYMLFGLLREKTDIGINYELELAERTISVQKLRTDINRCGKK